jgi:hypothetical protein
VTKGNENGVKWTTVRLPRLRSLPAEVRERKARKRALAMADRMRARIEEMYAK